MTPGACGLEDDTRIFAARRILGKHRGRLVEPVDREDDRRVGGERDKRSCSRGGARSFAGLTRRLSGCFDARAVYLGRVIGTVVATKKAEGLEGVKLLLVQPLDRARKPVGPPIAAADTARAGRGDLVYLTQAREAALALDPSFVPVDAAILGIVDAVES